MANSPGVIGIDLGGTKCAGGVIAPSGERIGARRQQPTEPTRGGEAVLADVTAMVQALAAETEAAGVTPVAVGIGIAELVDKQGQIVSAATIQWPGLAAADRLHAATGLPVRIDADVRAAARAEATLGAGQGFDSFLYVTIGTGISACLVIGGEPYTGSRGLTGTFASGRSSIPNDVECMVLELPLEQFSSGPALANRLAWKKSDFTGPAEDVLRLADAGDHEAQDVVKTAGVALGAAVAQLVNILDPAAIVVGGGLGLAGGRYRDRWERSMRDLVWAPQHRDLPVYDARLGADAGWIGAALAAWKSITER